MPITKEQIDREIQKRQIDAEIQRREAAQRTTGLDTGQTDRINFLLKQLGGRLPSGISLDEVLRTSQTPTGMSTEARAEIRRREALPELRGMGYNIEQISGALAFEQAIKPPSRKLRTIGAVVGGIAAGMATAGPEPTDLFTVPSVITALAGGGGAAIGETVQIFADPDRDFNIKHIARVFGEEAALDFAGQGIFRGIGKIPGVRRLVGGVQKTKVADAERLSGKLVRAGREIGIEDAGFLPAQFSVHQGIDTFQGIGENSLIGSNAFFQYKRGQIKSAAHLVNGVADSISEGASKRSFGDAADLFLDTLEDKGITHSMASRKLFGAIDVEMLESGIVRNVDEIVDMSPYRQLGQELRERATKADDIGLSASSLNMLDKAKNRTQNASFETAVDIRSGLLDIQRAAKSKLAPDPKAVGITSKLIKVLDNSMATAARNVSPKVEQMWRRANWFHKAGKKRFHNKIISKLMRDIPDNPEGAAIIFKNKKNILRAKKAVGKDVFQEVKGTWISKLIRDAAQADPTVAKGIGEPLGTRILRNFNNVGQEALDAAFTPLEQETVRDSARILAIVQARTGGQAGALKFVQGQALAGIVAAPLVEPAAGKQISRASSVLLIGPAVLGKLMLRPTFKKLLTEGFKAGIGTEQSIKITARLVRNVFQARREINEARLKRQREGTSKELAQKRRQIKKFALQKF